MKHFSLLISFLFFVGCATSPSDIYRDPNRFIGTDFVLSGVVSQSLSLPGVPLSVSLVRSFADSSDNIVVISASPISKSSSFSAKVRLLGYSDHFSSFTPAQKKNALWFLENFTSIPPLLREPSVSALEVGLRGLTFVASKVFFAFELL